MSKKNLIHSSSSKLSSTLSKISEANLKKEKEEKIGFIKKHDKTLYFKTKSFRLTEGDLENLNNITKVINESIERKGYSNSQIIRGIINYLSDHRDDKIKKIIPYVQNSH